MRITADTEARTLTVEDSSGVRDLDLYGEQAFGLLSDLWLKASWCQKYSYTFTWMGRPMIQYPEDVIRLQEVIYHLKPDVVVETGVAHGGSLIFYAGLLKAMDGGHVIGVDVEIRPHNRAAIEAHELASMITLVEGNSVAPDIVAQVAAAIRPGDNVLVLLDSDHSKAHVAAELAAYAPLVTPGSYIVATDGIMRDLHDVDRGDPSWREDNPAAAAAAFVASNPDFVLETPPWRFNESLVNRPITAWPDGWLKRRG